MSEPAETIPAAVVEHGESKPDSRQRHWLFLAVATLIAMLAWALEVLPNERVAFRGFPEWPLPHSCFSRAALGVSCPGCGLTRSFVYLARGDWHNAWREHRLGWLLAAIVALQFPYRGWALASGSRAALSPHFATGLAIIVAALLVINWGLKFATGG
jgi:hypothetical protein